nr:uncharacterized mitochondrial protein AtMg00810-like [Tanacetum cinerariifolium]
MKRLINSEYHDEIKIAELQQNFNGRSIEINKKEKLQQLERWANLNTYPSERFNSFCYDDDDDEDYTIAVTPSLSTKEPDNSLSMGDEHLDTIPVTESDEFIKSSVKNLVPIPSESEGIPDNMCDVSSHDNSLPLDVSKDQFEDFFDSNDEFSSTDDDSFSVDNIDYVEASPPDSKLISSEVMEIFILKVGGIDDDILLTIKDDILREKLLNVNLLIAKIEALNDNPTPFYDPIVSATSPTLTPFGERGHTSFRSIPNDDPSSDFETMSSSTSLNPLLEETNTFDNSSPEFETFCFDVEEISSGSTTTRSDISLPEYEAFYDDHVKEISSDSPTTHSDSSLYASFIFNLSINPSPPADMSDFYEFADELIHIISPPEYDYFLFKIEPNSGDFTMEPNEPFHSLNMGEEHLDTILAPEWDEFIKSSVENLVPITSEFEGESECDVPVCEEFTTFSNILFDADYESDSSDDQSFSDEDVPEKIFLTPLFDEEIIPMKIDQHPHNAESDLIESLRTHNSSLIILSKIDSLLDDFVDELALLKSIPPGIDETDCDFEEDIRLIKKLLYDNDPHKGDILLVQVYVDDIIFGSIKKDLCNAFERLMHEKFQMSYIGELKFFLGLQVKQKKDGIFISQDKYVTEILKKFGFTEVKTASTLIKTQKPLLMDEDGEEVDVHMYRSMIGSLMYVTSLRPDIMFVVCACARYQVNPKVSHLHAVKRIFRYLKGQPKLGLWYLKDSPFDLLAYTDSDYAGASLDRKSTTGGCQFLGCRSIS